MEKCDCLDYCGDDPRVGEGKVKTCSEWRAKKKYKKREALKENIMKLIDKYNAK